jgi:hypothetical protein
MHGSGEMPVGEGPFRMGDEPLRFRYLFGTHPFVCAPRLSLYPVKWLEFNYIHGWLVSEVIDSARSYYTNGGYKGRVQAKVPGSQHAYLETFPLPKPFVREFDRIFGSRRRPCCLPDPAGIL